jgi:glycosyltransferase involved in cell wall biosynthesis
VANEFFDPLVGGMGGYGWVARECALCLSESEFSLASEVSSRGSALFLTGNFPISPSSYETRTHGLPLVYARPMDWAGYVSHLHGLQIDLLLTIDYRPSYDFPLSALPETPMIVWVQDPRPNDDIEKVNTLRIPGSAAIPYGIHPIDCTGLAAVAYESELIGRPILFACPAPGLLDKAVRTFGLNTPRLEFLPYLLDFDPGRIRKSLRPTVVFLGRLDPIKRPWVVVELARLFPEVQFLLLGQAHFQGPGAWQPDSVPENVRLVGHVGGEEKRSLLASAWALINTSIHEALPVSFLEALLYEMPLISCQNPENLASSFGSYVGRWDGTGLEGLHAFSDGLSRVLDDQELRLRLGRKGQQWVRDHHGRANFQASFQMLYEKVREAASQCGSQPGAERSETSPPPRGTAAWHYQVLQIFQEMSAIANDGRSVILIDDAQVAQHSAAGLRTIPFLERDGEYFGPPPNDATAVRELERLRCTGAGWLAVAWPAFWWLDHYAGFQCHLHSNFRLVANSSRLVMFDLRPQAAHRESETP